LQFNKLEERPETDPERAKLQKLYKKMGLEELNYFTTIQVYFFDLAKLSAANPTMASNASNQIIKLVTNRKSLSSKISSSQLKDMFVGTEDEIRQFQNANLFEPAVNFASTHESKEARDRARLFHQTKDELTKEEALKVKQQCVGAPLGEGSFGKVFKVEFYNMVWAAKIIPVIPTKEKVVQEEINVHRMLRAKRCVLFRAAYTKPPDVVILTEFCAGGNLADRIYAKQKGLSYPPITDVLRYKFCLQIAEGLTELHHQNPPIVHRDLKPTNVLIDENENCKLCDFGFAHTTQQSSIASSVDMRSRSGAGTDLYKAPEVWDPDQKSGAPSDIYSFGILIHELFTSSVPWSDQTKEGLWSSHMKGLTPPVDAELRQSHPKVAHIIDQCVRSDPNKRPQATQLISAFRVLLDAYLQQAKEQGHIV